MVFKTNLNSKFFEEKKLSKCEFYSPLCIFSKNAPAPLILKVNCSHSRAEFSHFCGEMERNEASANKSPLCHSTGTTIQKSTLLLASCEVKWCCEAENVNWAAHSLFQEDSPILAPPLSSLSRISGRG